MSGNPTSNVVPMPGSTSWPTAPWPSTAVPPGCFSELARLNQCYNEVQMMEMILSKVVCDLAQNNTAFQQCLVNAIAASGSNVPLIGVTNGSQAQPGQVGEWIQFQVNGNYTAGPQTQIVSVGTLPAGDWGVQAWCSLNAPTGGVSFILESAVPQISNDMAGFLPSDLGVSGFVECLGIPARTTLASPALFAFTLNTNITGAGGAAAGTFGFFMAATRRR